MIFPISTDRDIYEANYYFLVFYQYLHTYSNVIWIFLNVWVIICCHRLRFIYGLVTAHILQSNGNWDWWHHMDLLFLVFRIRVKDFHSNPHRLLCPPHVKARRLHNLEVGDSANDNAYSTSHSLHWKFNTGFDLTPSGCRQIAGICSRRSYMRLWKLCFIV